MSSFPKLFKSSKFATYDPTLKQIYTSFGKHKHRGDFGFKKNLPFKWRAPFVFVPTVETPEKQVAFDSALHEYLLWRRYCLNFGNTQEWNGPSLKDEFDPNKASNKETEAFWKKVNDLIPKWRKMKNENKVEDREIFEFFGVKKQDGLQAQKLDIAPPRYTKTTEVKKVRGRILNRLNGGYAVGVNGTVCFLRASKVGYTKHLVYDFYVQQSRIDNELRPCVELTDKAPRVLNSPETNDENSDFEIYKNQLLNKIVSEKKESDDEELFKLVSANKIENNHNKK